MFAVETWTLNTIPFPEMESSVMRPYWHLRNKGNIVDLRPHEDDIATDNRW
jgi:hypothetical protein